MFSSVGMIHARKRSDSTLPFFLHFLFLISSLRTLAELEGHRNVWQRPSLVQQLYEELFPLVTFTTENSKKKTTLDIRLIEKQCPLLLSCQREGVRFANHAVTRRSINDDTLLTDEDGTTV